MIGDLPPSKLDLLRKKQEDSKQDISGAESKDNKKRLSWGVSKVLEFYKDDDKNGSKS